MANFLLQPCRHRTGRLTPDRHADPIPFSLDQFLQHFELKQDPLFLAKIQSLRVGAYVGRSQSLKDSKKSVCFVFHNPQESDDFSWILEKDSTFEARILEVYQILRMVRPSKMEESEVRT